MLEQGTLLHLCIASFMVCGLISATLLTWQAVRLARFLAHRKRNSHQPPIENEASRDSAETDLLLLRMFVPVQPETITGQHNTREILS